MVHFCRTALLSVLSVSLFSGCANFSRKTTDESTKITDIKDSQVHTTPYMADSYYGEIPSEINPSVLKWINYFQGRGRRHMERYLQRSTRYLPLMKEVFRERGMPEDLVYIALIESGFNSGAYSHASAVGYWQFIRGTGKRYRLKINSYVDERRDPVLSTHAAANYFHDLYGMFGDWRLSMASYNAGENRIKRLIRRYRTRDFWELTKKRRMPRETKNYVPKFIAAREIARNPEKYGFEAVNYQDAFSYDSVQVTQPISLDKLAKKLNVDYKELKRMNPRYRSDFVPVYSNRDNYIRVPQGMKLAASAAIDFSVAKGPIRFAPHTYSYRIRRGDTLSGIAHRNGTSVRKLMALNNISSRTLLRVGRRLRVPQYGHRSLALSKKRTRRAIYGGKYHVVRKGESLSVIAQRYRVSMAKLRRWNRLSRRSMIRVGQRLKIGESQVASSSRSRKPSSVKYYVVQRGDTLIGIAKRFGVSVSELRRLNGLKKRSFLKIGQKLSLKNKSSSSELSKARKFHVVRRGENLLTIAKRYKVSIAKIVRENKINNRSKIFVGSRLVIP